MTGVSALAGSFSSIQIKDLDQVADRALMGALVKCGNTQPDMVLRFNRNVPEYSEIPGEESIYLNSAKPNKRSAHCFSFVTRLLTSRTRQPEAQASAQSTGTTQYVQLLGYHAPKTQQAADSQIENGLSTDHVSAAHNQGMESAGEGYYVAADVSGARNYLQDGGILQVWAVMDTDQFDPREMHTDEKGDLVVTADAQRRLFFQRHT